LLFFDLLNNIKVLATEVESSEPTFEARKENRRQSGTALLSGSAATMHGANDAYRVFLAIFPVFRSVNCTAAAIRKSDFFHCIIARNGAGADRLDSKNHDR